MNRDACPWCGRRANFAPSTDTILVCIACGGVSVSESGHTWVPALLDELTKYERAHVGRTKRARLAALEARRRAAGRI